VRVLFELSGEHPTLPRAEALAALEAEGVSARSISFGPSVLIVEALRPPARAWRRIALSRHVGTVLATGGFDRVLTAARNFRGRSGSIRVRAPALKGDDRLAAERELGEVLLEPGGRADLENPDLDFRLVGNGELHLVRVLHTVDRASFERAQAARRSLGQPISLHPKFARALVNLSRCPTGGRLLDPFCGTGGILIEAARIGIHAIGGDLLPAMVERSRGTLADVRGQFDLRVADVGEWSSLEPRVDAVATDPPYGRSTTTAREPLGSLYRRAFATFAKALRPGAYAAVVLPSDPAVRIGEEFLDLVESHPLRVHRSLTRRFCAFRARRRRGP